MKKLYTSAAINLYLHMGAHTGLELEWLDFVNSNDLRQSLTEALRLAKEHHIKSWIADNRLIRAVRPIDFEWMGEHIIPPLHQLGVRRMAVIESTDAVNRMGVNRFLQTVLPATAIELRYFQSVPEARLWACSA